MMKLARELITGDQVCGINNGRVQVVVSVETREFGFLPDTADPDYHDVTRVLFDDGEYAFIPGCIDVRVAE
jgi:hypothetical protein